jgi:Fe-S-cluster containining protein
VPTYYDCQRCTACCRWPGEVRVTDAELRRLAAFRGVSENDFIQQFMRLSSDRLSLVLAEKPNGECIFLDGSDCSVQTVKPQQCRDFPNVWNFPGFRKSCHALARDVSDDDYRRLVAHATGRKPEDIRLPQPEQEKLKRNALA